MPMRQSSPQENNQGIANPPSSSQPNPGGGPAYSPAINHPDVEKYRSRRKARRKVFSTILMIVIPAIFIILSFSPKTKNPLPLLGGALLSFLLIFFIYKGARRSLSIGYDGVIINKQILRSTTDDGDGVRVDYTPTLSIRSVEGSTFTISLPENKVLYEHYLVGEQVRKHGGFAYPEKLVKQRPTILCINCGQVFDINNGKCPGCGMVAIK